MRVPTTSALGLSLPLIVFASDAIGIASLAPVYLRPGLSLEPLTLAGRSPEDMHPEMSAGPAVS